MITEKSIYSSGVKKSAAEPKLLTDEQRVIALIFNTMLMIKIIIKIKPENKGKTAGKNNRMIETGRVITNKKSEDKKRAMNSPGSIFLPIRERMK